MVRGMIFMNSLFLGFVACFVAYFITDFFCQKLGIERLINSKRHMRISLFLIATIFNIIFTSIIENFVSREYHFLLKSFLAGATFYFIVFILPFNNKKIK